MKKLIMSFSIKTFDLNELLIIVLLMASMLIKMFGMWDNFS